MIRKFTMIEIIKKAFKYQRIVSICIGKVNWDKRILGYIKSIDQTSIIVSMVDIYGAVIKSKSVKINTISIIEISDSYNKHLEKLKPYSELIKKEKSLYINHKNHRFLEKIGELISTENICTIFLGTEYMTGILRKVNETDLFIDNLGYSGTHEGKSCIKLSLIARIRYQGPKEKKIFYLLNDH